MNILKIIADYYILIGIIVGVMGSLAISISDEIYEMDLVLTDKEEFVRCVFMYQFTVYELLKDEIKKTGIIILEILTTLNVWFLNIFIFVIVGCLWIIKLICYLFWLIFRKREDENADD